jgi:hypothetical protein
VQKTKVIKIYVGPNPSLKRIEIDNKPNKNEIINAVTRPKIILIRIDSLLNNFQKTGKVMSGVQNIAYQRI